MSNTLEHKPHQELLQQGRERLRRQDPEGALERFMQVLQQHPDSLEAHDGCGRALGNLGRHQEALQCFARALAIRPDHVESLNNQGVALHKLGHNSEALACFARALELAPAHPGALTNCGFVLQAEGRLEEALACLDAALRVTPHSVAAMHARGMTLERLGAYERALGQLETVVKADPGHVDAWSSRGVVLSRLGRTAQARASFHRALELAPGNPDVLYRLSFVQLAEGELLEGFRGQTLRWTAMLPRLDAGTGCPIWLGGLPLHGKTLLLHHEQGFGDTLQFVRYAPLAAAHAGRVLLRVPQPLIRLLSTLEGGVQVVSAHEPVPPHDLHCPITCLPAAMGTALESIPAPRSYLRAQAQDVRAWSERMGPRQRPRIGLVWRGHPQYALAAERDLPLKHLVPLTQLQAELISLQKEVPPGEQADLAALGQIARYGEELTDFADTAALIQNLDLVISADTAVAHLAGALGKPVWILNRFAPCWRWLCDGRSDSPWYPSARLFRQGVPGGWRAVVEEVKQAAQLFIARSENLSVTQGLAPGPSSLEQPSHSGGSPHVGADGQKSPESAANLLQAGMSAAGRGDRSAALACFARALELEPGNAVALINRGSMLATLGQLDEALGCFQRVPDGHPLQVEALSNSGYALRRLGRPQDALDCLDRALAIKPRHGAALINRGLTLCLQGKWEEAAASLAAGVAEAPRHLDGLSGLGRALTQLGCRAEAMAAIEQALAIQPRHLPALDTRAYLLLLEGRHEEALRCLDTLLEADSGNVEALSNRGCALLATGRTEESVRCLEQALERDPTHARALDNYCAALLRAWRHQEALSYLDRALYSQPGHQDTLHHRAAVLFCLHRLEEALETLDRMATGRCPPRSTRLRGQILLELDRQEEALQCFDAALAEDCADEEAALLRALALEELMRIGEAKEGLDRLLATDCTDAAVIKLRAVLLDRLGARNESLVMFDRALALDPACPETRYDRSLVLLALGRLEEGFRDMEARWSMPRAQPPHLASAAPLWLGNEPIQGKTLLVDAEQGLGDTLQFARYVPAVALQGGRVIFRASPVLHRALATLAGQSQLVSDRDPPPAHDLRCPVMSLALAFNTTLESIPAPVPYLLADPAAVAAWGKRLGPNIRPRIGIVWAGRQQWPQNHRRDMPLELLRPLLSLNAHFISLQKDIPPCDRPALTQLPGLANLGEQLTDFADTAALLENIDLLISVDTSVVHLAGALGRPVWVMSRYAACWRWLQGRSSSPWYPSLRLFRQASHGEWESVVSEVKQAAQSWVQEWALQDELAALQGGPQ